VLASKTVAPVALRLSTVCAFTVAWVPTGMKTGVSTGPCRVWNLPARAWEPDACRSRVKLSGTWDR